MLMIWHGDFTLRFDSDFIYLFPGRRTLHYAIKISYLLTLRTSEAVYFTAELVRRRHLFTKEGCNRGRTVFMMSGFGYDPELRAMIEIMYNWLVRYATLLQPQNTKKRRGNLIAALNQLEREWLTAPELFKLPLTANERASFVHLRETMLQKLFN